MAINQQIYIERVGERAFAPSPLGLVGKSGSEWKILLRVRLVERFLLLRLHGHVA